MTIEEFATHSEEYDRLVWNDQDLDRFCSSSDWQISAYASFHHREPTLIARLDSGYAAFFSQNVNMLGRTLIPLEASWFLGSPLIGEVHEDLAAEWLAYLEQMKDWQACVISGLKRNGSLMRALSARLAYRFPYYAGTETIRRVADLSKGVDGFLANRSPRFRKRLRQAEKKARSIDWRFEWLSEVLTEAEALAAFERIMNIERTSWKGRRGEGIEDGAMRAFYDKLVRRQSANGRMRLGFAQIEGRDAGYILGGVIGHIYRGYQFSFNDDYRDYSPGNLMQWETIQRLIDEGVEVYDQGMDMPYKRRWTEQAISTEMLVIVNRP